MLISMMRSKFLMAALSSGDIVHERDEFMIPLRNLGSAEVSFSAALGSNYYD